MGDVGTVVEGQINLSRGLPIPLIEIWGNTEDTHCIQEASQANSFHHDTDSAMVEIEHHCVKFGQPTNTTVIVNMQGMLLVSLAQK